jgi:hypothetical protein
MGTVIIIAIISGAIFLKLTSYQVHAAFSDQPKSMTVAAASTEPISHQTAP